MARGARMSTATLGIHQEWDVVEARTVADLEALRPVWEAVQSREPHPVINTEIDRFLSVVEAEKVTQPFALLLRHGGEPVAMLLGRIAETTVDMRLGYKTLLKPRLRCLTVVYGGVLGRPNERECRRLVELLLKALSVREFDAVLFNHLPTDSRIYRLCRELPGALVRDRVPKTEDHWCMTLPASMDEFYLARSSKHRKHLKSYLKKLEKDFPGRVRTVLFTREDEVEDAARMIARVSSRSYQHALGAGFDDGPKERALLRLAARKGWLRVHVLLIDDQPCAFRLVLQYGDTCFGGGIGYDPRWARYRVGTILFLTVLAQLCQDASAKRYDFGFGDAEYKESYANECWQEASVFIFAPRLYPVSVNLLRTGTAGLNGAFQYLADRTGVTAWVKRRWRDRLQATVAAKAEPGEVLPSPVNDRSEEVGRIGSHRQLEHARHSPRLSAEYLRPDAAHRVRGDRRGQRVGRRLAPDGALGVSSDRPAGQPDQRRVRGGE